MNIKHLLKSVLVGFCVLPALSAVAQSYKQATPPPVSCQVIDTGLTPRISTGEDAFRAFPIEWDSSSTEDLIYRGPGVYVFRFAACISNAEFRTTFKSDKNLVYRFWDTLEEYMNNIYTRDCGIRFEVIRNDKLIYADKEHESLSGVDGHNNASHKAPRIINDAIGVENYEVGILVIPIGPRDPFNGLAAKSGVLLDTQKASARAISDTRIIAHEVGHLFGSIHTQERNPNGSIFTEFGLGQSIMSYGFPVNFFSLPTVQVIRRTLKSLPYYTDKSRTTKITANKVELKSAPYIEPFKTKAPEILTNKLSKEYKVTPKTRYQFYIPVKDKQKGDLFAAHSFDPTTNIKYANHIQRCYEPSESNLIMFHPRYKEKSSSSNINEEEAVLPGSNDYKQSGTYTYLLSAYQGGQHSSYTIKLKVVPGKEFKINKVTGIDNFYSIVPGARFGLEWEPCTELYGRDSKVRILLSDDFGQTFKYVLADNVVNNGKWTGEMPYINISGKYISGVNNVRAGVLKVEVIGEVAYALSHEIPYKVQGRNAVPSGGFLVNPKNTKAIQFTPTPEVYLEVADRSQVPTAEVLSASYNGGRAQQITANERTDGNLIYRTWTAKIGSKTSVYTQLIKVLSDDHDGGLTLRAKLRGLQDRATDVYKNLGTIGYPYGQLKESKDLRDAYERAFVGKELKQGATEADYQALLSALEALGKVEDWQIVKPITGYSYKFASYAYIFGKDTEHYARRENGGETFGGVQESDATTWQLKEQDGVYKFTSNGDKLNLEGVASYDGGVLLHKGDTWGSMMLLGRNAVGSYYYVRGDKSNGQLSKHELSGLNRIVDFRMNSKAVSVSTDYIFKPIGKSYKIYLEHSSWTGAKAHLSQQGRQTEIVGTSKGNGTFEFDIPEAFILAGIEFSNTNNPSEKTPLAYLGGVSTTFNQSGKRVYDVANLSSLSTLYLDYPVTIPQGIKAYVAVAKPVGTGTIKEYQLELSQLQGTIPAKTAVVISAEHSNGTQSVRFVEADLVAPPAENSLVGSLDDVLAEDQEQSFYYFDLTAPVVSGANYTFSPIQNKSLRGHTAYLRLYRYKSGESLERVLLPTSLEGNAPAPRPEQARIVINNNAGGDIRLADNIDANAVAVGTAVKVVATPHEGYKLLSITANGEDITESKTFTVRSGENQVEAVWKKITALDSEALTASIKIYPNPANDFVVLSGVPHGAEYKVYTLNGILVLQGEVDMELQTISLSALPSGTYVLRIADTSHRIYKL